jgi:hypothetical protein
MPSFYRTCARLSLVLLLLFGWMPPGHAGQFNEQSGGRYKRTIRSPISRNDALSGVSPVFPPTIWGPPFIFPR